MENNTEKHKFPYLWKPKESNFKKDKGKCSRVSLVEDVPQCEQWLSKINSKQ